MKRNIWASKIIKVSTTSHRLCRAITYWYKICVYATLWKIYDFQYKRWFSI